MIISCLQSFAIIYSAVVTTLHMYLCLVYFYRMKFLEVKLEVQVSM